MKHLKNLSIVLAILGLLAGTLLVGWYGFGKIVDATLSVGGRGFVILCLWQFLLFAILGLAWGAIAPPEHRRPLGAFVWGRMVRDAASSCLPFSQVGGFVLGARAAALHGIPWSVATISTVVDLLAEFVAEIAFAVAGLLVLLDRSSDRALVVPIEIGVGAAVVLGAVILRLQRSVAPIFVRMGRRILGEWFDGGDQEVARGQAELAEAFGHIGRLRVGTAIHLLGWFGKGVGNWLAFHLLGANIDLIGALAIEALLHALLAVAFLVPGYAGVQEAGYAALGSLFGVPPEISIGVSLVRRARDIAIGVPILLVWQLFEIRRLPAAKGKKRPETSPSNRAVSSPDS